MKDPPDVNWFIGEQTNINSSNWGGSRLEQRVTCRRVLNSLSIQYIVTGRYQQHVITTTSVFCVLAGRVLKGFISV